MRIFVSDLDGLLLRATGTDLGKECSSCHNGLCRAGQSYEAEYQSTVADQSVLNEGGMYYDVTGKTIRLWLK